MKKLILVLVIIIAAGFLWSTKKNGPTGLELLVNDVVFDRGLTASGEFKIFETLESPTGKYTAVFFGPESGEAPVGVMVAEDIIIKKSFIAEGDWNVLRLENLVWKDEDTISFTQVSQEETIERGFSVN